MLGGIDYVGEGLLTWTLVGAFVGYMMGYFREELNEGTSVFSDIAAGILGAVVSGFVVHYFIGGRTGFYISIAVSAICAIGLTAARDSARQRRRRVY